jgi:hypothetical protein
MATKERVAVSQVVAKGDRDQWQRRRAEPNIPYVSHKRDRTTDYRLLLYSRWADRRTRGGKPGDIHRNIRGHHANDKRNNDHDY